MKKILFLYPYERQIVTGGQKYEDNLYHILRDSGAYEVERLWLGLPKGRSGKLLNWRRLLRRAEEYGSYDVIFLNSVYGLDLTPLARRLVGRYGRKVCVVHHHFLYEGVSGFRRRYYRLLETRFLRAASTVVIPSPFILDKCKALFPLGDFTYWQIPFEKSVCSLPPSPRPGRLLYIGTVERRKGTDKLIEAMALLKERGVECSLSIVGKIKDEAMHRDLAEKVAAANLDVSFLGFVDDSEKARLMAEADVFVFPSRQEGYGMALCEAMTEGLPVVCFDNSAMPYTVVDGENGFLVPDGDAGSFADAVARIVTDRAVRRRLSQGALDTASRLMTPARFRDRVLADVAAMCGGQGL